MPNRKRRKTTAANDFSKRVHLTSCFVVVSKRERLEHLTQTVEMVLPRHCVKAALNFPCNASQNHVTRGKVGSNKLKKKKKNVINERNLVRDQPHYFNSPTGVMAKFWSGIRAATPNSQMK